MPKEVKEKLVNEELNILSDSIDRKVNKVNEQVNIPLLSEDAEQKLFTQVITRIIELHDKGASKEEILKSFDEFPIPRVAIEVIIDEAINDR